jgi:hypothetical protein
VIAIVDDVLSEARVKYCIDIFTRDIPLREYFGKFLIDNNERLGDDQEFNNILSIINVHASKINPNVCIDWSHLNFWPTFSRQDLHHDSKSEETVFTSITYLNCTYRGGETFFEDGTTVAPIVGRTVFFDGMKYLHGVKPISQGTRFTLSAWYKQRK